MGSSGAASYGLYGGVAQSVRFVVLKALDKNGKGKTSTLIDAIEYVIASKARLGIYVINLSLGHPIYEPPATDPLVQEVERATRAGLIVWSSNIVWGSLDDDGPVRVSSLGPYSYLSTVGSF